MPRLFIEINGVENQLIVNGRIHVTIDLAKDKVKTSQDEIEITEDSKEVSISMETSGNNSHVKGKVVPGSKIKKIEIRKGENRPIRFNEQLLHEKVITFSQPLVVILKLVP